MSDRTEVACQLAIMMKARKLVANQFTKQAAARNKDGDECDPLCDDAITFCSVGALVRYIGKDSMYELWPFVECMGFFRPSLLMDFHDSHTKAEVLAKFDEGIAKLGAKIPAFDDAA